MRTSFVPACVCLAVCFVSACGPSTPADAGIDVSTPLDARDGAVDAPRDASDAAVPTDAPWPTDAGVFAPCGSLGFGQVSSVAVTADATWVAIAGTPHEIVVFRTSDHAVIHRLAGPGITAHLAFAGRNLVAVGTDGALSVWDVAHEAVLFTHALVPAQTLAVAGSATQFATLDGTTVNLWNLADGTLARSWTTPGLAFALAFSPDGQSLVVGDGLYRVSDGSVALAASTTPSGYPTAVAFSPDGQAFATAYNGLPAEVVLRRTTDGSTLSQVSSNIENDLSSVAFMPDGRSVALARLDGVDVVPVRDASGHWLATPGTGTSLARPYGPYPVDLVTVASTATGAVLIASEQRDVLAWDPTSTTLATDLPVVLGLPAGGQGVLGWSQDGTTLITGTGTTPPAIRVMDATTLTDRYVLLGARTAALSPDGTTLLTSDQGSADVVGRDTATGAVRGRMTLPSPTLALDIVQGGLFDGAEAAVLGMDGHVRRLDLQVGEVPNGTILGTIVPPYDAPGGGAQNVFYDVDGALVAIAFAGGVEVYASGGVLRYQGGVSGVSAFSADGSYFANAALDGRHIEIVRTADGSTAWNLPAFGAPTAVVFDPQDGSLVIASSPSAASGEVLHVAPTGQVREHFTVDSEAWAQQVALSHDGRRLAIGWSNGFVALYCRP